MSRFGSQYQIARPTGVCAATGATLEPGSACVATLVEREEAADDHGLERKDFSLDAWESGARPERLFSFWRTEVVSPEQRRRLLVDDEVLMDLFMRLADETSEQRVAFRFVLALILMRKRQLKFLGRRRDEASDTEYWQFRPRGSEPDTPAVEAINPHLNDDDVRELTAQLSEILQGEVN